MAFGKVPLFHYEDLEKHIKEGKVKKSKVSEAAFLNNKKNGNDYGKRKVVQKGEPVL